MPAEKIPPIHPGEILLEEFMKPMGISQIALARALKVPPKRINEIIHGRRGVTVDTALRLSRHFGTSVQFWIGLQDDYDLDVAEESLLVERINKEVMPRVATMP
ncbi:MAG: HigA family addiction module antitoxin [Thermodesulfobacteriota bacterium]